MSSCPYTRPGKFLISVKSVSTGTITPGKSPMIECSQNGCNTYKCRNLVRFSTAICTFSKRPSGKLGCKFISNNINSYIKINITFPEKWCQPRRQKKKQKGTELEGLLKVKSSFQTNIEFTDMFG